MKAMHSFAVRAGRSAVSRAKARLPHRQLPVILMYHRIAEEPFDPWGLAVTATRFRDQLRWLSRHRTVLRLSEFVALHRSSELPNRAVAITMDDGYACSVDVAAPLLDEFGIPATVFLPASLIDHGRPFWWDELEAIVLTLDKTTLEVEGQPVDLGERTADDRQWRAGRPAGTERQTAFLNIHGRLVRKSPAGLNRAMDEIRAQAGANPEISPLKMPLTSDQVRQAPRVIDFGSHTLTHPWMPSLTAAERRREILDSVEGCRRLTGKRPETFAYPFGAVDDQSRGLVEEAGFDCACTTEEFAVSPASGIFALPRLNVGNWSHARLRRALSDVTTAEAIPAIARA